MPLKLPAIQFGFGHGSGARAPDEYYLIESKNPNIQASMVLRALTRRVSIRIRIGEVIRC
jgi:hypothetical protein